MLSARARSISGGEILRAPRRAQDDAIGNLQSAMPLHDQHGRRITDLRISVTDRCNYRCVYCRTGRDGAQYPELPIADYLRMAKLFVALGIEKVRLTGGEPLLRAGLL